MPGETNSIIWQVFSNILYLNRGFECSLFNEGNFKYSCPTTISKWNSGIYFFFPFLGHVYIVYIFTWQQRYYKTSHQLGTNIFDDVSVLTFFKSHFQFWKNMVFCWILARRLHEILTLWIMNTSYPMKTICPNNKYRLSIGHQKGQ